MENQVNKKDLILKGLLSVLKSEFLGIFVFLFFWAVSLAMGKLANIIFGIAGVLTVFSIMADFGLKQGEKTRKKVVLHGVEPCRNFGLTIGLVAMIPSYLTLVVLALSRLGVIGNFLPAYKLLNACFFPLIDLVAHTSDVAKMNPMAFIMFALLPLLYPLSTWLSFRWGYDQVDLKTKIMYKNK